MQLQEVLGFASYQFSALVVVGDNEQRFVCHMEKTEAGVFGLTEDSVAVVRNAPVVRHDRSSLLDLRRSARLHASTGIGL